MTLALLGLAACAGPELDIPLEQTPIEVRSHPPTASGTAGRIVRLEVSPGGEAELGELGLFTGELSEYHERRLASGDVPGTLEARRVPIVEYLDGDGSRWIVPTVRLEDGLYSLASSERGSIHLFEVSDVVSGDAGAPGLAERVWPTVETTTRGQHGVYCAPRLDVVVGDAFQLQPGSVPAVWRRVGTDDRGRTCGWAEVTAPRVEGSEVVPPLELGGALLSPDAWRASTVDATREADCVVPEQPLGPGCAIVEDDRVRIRAPAEPTFWWVERPGAAEATFLLDATADGASLTVRGLAPDGRQALSIVALTAAGAVYAVEADVRTAPERDHVVIDEVMANPSGAEPAQEWVEIVNDGPGAVNVGGWVIEDTSGATVLPERALDPGERALVVREDFARAGSLDVGIPEDVPLLRVPAIGGNGLSNGGEALRLIDRAGRVVSTFPAYAANTAGTSICRFAPWIPDDELWGFGAHAPPGASPGAPNDCGD